MSITSINCGSPTVHLLIRHNVHFISDDLTQNKPARRWILSHQAQSGTSRWQKSVYAPSMLNKRARASLAPDSVFPFPAQFVSTEGKPERCFIWLHSSCYFRWVVWGKLGIFGLVWSLRASYSIQRLSQNKKSQEKLIYDILKHMIQIYRNIRSGEIPSCQVTHRRSDKTKTLPFCSLENKLRKRSWRNLSVNARNVLHTVTRSHAAGREGKTFTWRKLTEQYDPILLLLLWSLSCTES